MRLLFVLNFLAPRKRTLSQTAPSDAITWAACDTSSIPSAVRAVRFGGKMYPDAVRFAIESLSGDTSFVFYQNLPYPPDEVFLATGIYIQAASTIDLDFRRIFFALRAAGDNDSRGPEKATLAQIFERLPDAINRSPIKLYRKKHFPRLLEVIGQLLIMRNEVAHSACRWHPPSDLLIFAHANENVGQPIKTGNRISYYSIDRRIFLSKVADLKKMGGYIGQYTATWLPKLRPWLPSFLDGQPDPDGTRAEQLFAEMERRSRNIDVEE